ncbi:hypothetical protein NP233_g12079 [Leucocoprinus birnbaumii]|uniref:Muskelin N-terminal domain-containing protein n=1 Tax=Leucocoprinus birnbaumii TaxID=56174 RepID=A0AAD5VGZ3_9AGAR|nr:hypothetical protein NP233_g12079 [Leucocoprinus birnbaumii]
MSSMPPSVPLPYTVALSTPHSGKYGPEHILLDKPQDQSSRWSGAYQGNNSKQWILLKLDQLSILKTLTFGKFSKPHPCNMKDFKVYVGITEENLVEVLHGGLKNDTTPEAFSIRHINNAQVIFPTRYIKIVPLSAHGQNFHTSIWHISMTGIVDKKYVDHIYRIHEEHRESTVLRHVLKHLRQRRLLTPYQDILSRAFTTVEHPLVTQLHTTLVLQGAFKDSEKHLQTLSSSGLFSTFLQSSHPYAAWSRVTGTDRDGDTPPPRSGHAMCMDHVNGVVYVHGGYNSDKCLDDFWAYSTRDDEWRKLSDSTYHQNGPGPRSCHKMAFDAKTGSIFILGRLTDVDASRTPVSRRGPTSTIATAPTNPQRLPQHPNLPPLPPHPTTDPPIANSYNSELYLYHTRGPERGTWRCISFDTGTNGGPPLVFDHQMVVDSERQILYVYGGRVLDGDLEKSKYAGLYAYNIKTGRWKLLQPADSTPLSIPARYGHSMVLEHNTNTLFIFGGQREDKYLSDMYTYDLSTNTASEIFSNFTTAGGPDACFTQRAIIDTDLKEIYVFCGLTLDSAGMTGFLPGELYNWVYRYGTRPGTWTRILPEGDQSRNANPASSPPFKKDVSVRRQREPR